VEFLQLLIASLQYGTATASVFVFVCSAVLLAAGIAGKTRSRVRLSFLDDTPLSRIEFTHPHLPSARAVMTVTLCALALLLVGLRTMRGTVFFDDPYEGMNLASLFLVGGSVAILAELRWKQAASYVSGLLTGTALAFLPLSVWRGGWSGVFSDAVLFFGLLPLALLLAVFTFLHERSKGGLLTAIATVAFWILVSLVR
jgi:hypothetical protein